MLKSQNSKHLPNEKPRHVHFLLGSIKPHPQLLWEMENTNAHELTVILQLLPVTTREKPVSLKTVRLPKRSFSYLGFSVLGFIRGV